MRRMLGTLAVAVVGGVIAFAIGSILAVLGPH